MRIELAPRVIVDDQIHAGRPIIAGTRVPVDVLLGQLAAGLSVEEVTAEYGVSRDDVLAALAYAAKTLGNEEIRAAG